MDIELSSVKTDASVVEISSVAAAAKSTSQTVPNPSGTTTGTMKIDLSYDPRDTNQDGVVSPQENFEYSLTHPQNNLNFGTVEYTAGRVIAQNGIQSSFLINV